MGGRQKITKSSGNVFADLDLPNAADEDTKMDLAVAINDEITTRGLPQVDAAKLISAMQPQVSALVRYRLDGFSIGRLVGFLTALGRDVEIGHRPTGSGAPGRVRVRELDAADV